MAEANFRTAPIEDLTAHVVLRAHRRYGLATPVPAVTAAWQLLAGSVYTEDLSVQDGTGVPHLPGYDTGHFLPNRYTPVPKLCMTVAAWAQMINAAAFVSSSLEPFRYDLVSYHPAWTQSPACTSRPSADLVWSTGPQSPA